MESSFAQQGNLPCNPALGTPWVNNSTPLFTVTESHSATALGSWDVSCGLLCTTNTAPFAIDNNLTNFATGSFVAAGSVTLSVKDATNDYSAGNYAGFKINRGGLGTADNITIKTYLTTGGPRVLQDSYSGTNLTLTVVDLSGSEEVGFITTKNYDEIEITFGGLGVAGSIDVYYAFNKAFCAGTLVCNTLTNFVKPAQPAYVDGANTGIIGLLCAGCSIANPDNVVNADTTDFATITLTVGVAVSAQFAVADGITTHPAGTFAGFNVQTNTLLSAAVISNATLQLLNNGVVVQTGTGNALMVGATTSSLTGQSRQVVGLVGTVPFDEVKITFNQLVGADLGNILIYNAVWQSACPGTIACNSSYNLNAPSFPVVIDGANTGINSAACAACYVRDPWAVVTASATDFAKINLPVSVISSGSIAVQNAIDTYPAQTVTGFTIRDNNFLVTASLFNAITITTFNNGVVQESRSDSSLIDLTLISSIFGGGSGVRNIGFVTTLPWDEVKITVSNLAGALAQDVDVFGAFIDTRFVPAGTPGLICIQPPVAETDHTITSEDTPVSGNLSTNDRDPQGLVLTYNTTPTVAPANGTVVINSNGTFTYTPNTGFTGVDSFKYTVCNSANVCASAWVFITVTPKNSTLPGNNPPLAQNDYSQTLSGRAVTGNAQNNDVDPDGNALSYTLLNNTKNGNLVLNANGTYTYTPNIGFVGNDTARYQVCDNALPPACATALIVITVSPDINGTPNDPPFAQDDVNATIKGVPVSGNILANDSDPNGDALTATPIDPLPAGLTINSNGSYTYNPPDGFTGTMSVRYKVCDVGGLCDTATLSIDVIVSFTLRLKVLLEGSTYSNANPLVMRDNLRNSPFTGLRYIPDTDPYTNNPVYTTNYTAVGDGTNPALQTVSNPATMFADHGNNTNIVDWVFIEIRDKTTPATVVATRSGLVQKDGNVVDIDGSSCVQFPSLASGDYYVSVRHRNHLGAMTATSLPGSTFTCSSPVVDFTTMTNEQLFNKPGYDGLEMQTVTNGVTSARALWACDADGSKKIKYTAPQDDLSRIFNEVLGIPGNTTFSTNYNFGFGYWSGDVNMDSKVKYTAPQDDPSFVFNTILNYRLNGSFVTNYNFFIEQLP